MKKFLVGVYVGASAVFIWGMFIEIQRMTEIMKHNYIWSEEETND